MAGTRNKIVKYHISSKLFSFLMSKFPRFKIHWDRSDNQCSLKLTSENLRLKKALIYSSKHPEQSDKKVIHFIEELMIPED